MTLNGMLSNNKSTLTLYTLPIILFMIFQKPPCKALLVVHSYAKSFDKEFKQWLIFVSNFLNN